MFSCVGGLMRNSAATGAALARPFPPPGNLTWDVMNMGKMEHSELVRRFINSFVGAAIGVFAFALSWSRRST
jgi:hypothetical protein